MGWDGLDELRAQLRGMRTQTFTDLPFRHHRPEGGRELSSLHQGEALGRASWYMGYRPTYLAMRALYRAPQRSRLRWPCSGGMPRRRRAALRAAPTGCWWASCAGASGWEPRCAAARRRPEDCALV